MASVWENPQSYSWFFSGVILPLRCTSYKIYLTDFYNVLVANLHAILLEEMIQIILIFDINSAFSSSHESEVCQNWLSWFIKVWPYWKLFFHVLEWVITEKIGTEWTDLHFSFTLKQLTDYKSHSEFLPLIWLLLKFCSKVVKDTDSIIAKGLSWETLIVQWANMLIIWKGGETIVWIHIFSLNYCFLKDLLIC